MADGLFQLPKALCSGHQIPQDQHLPLQDRGWYAAQERYADFLRRHKQGKVLYLELGVGHNTPGIIKYPFWRYTLENPEAVYACVNAGQAYAPREIADRSICLDMDIRQFLEFGKA